MTTKVRNYHALFKWEVNDNLKTYLKNHLSHIENLNLIFPDDISEDNLLKLAPDADVIIGWRPSAELLEKAKKLRLFINPGAGVQHLLPLFKNLPPERCLTLVNGHGNSYFTAQHAVSLLLSLTNRILLHHQWLKAGKWRTGDKEAKSSPLRDKTIGLLGYGAVNQKVHLFLSGFDVKFAVLKKNWTKTIENIPTPIKKFTTEEFHSFLTQIDVLIIALPHTRETNNMITAKELDLLGSEGIIINMARGGVINEEDFYNALNNQKIFGAGIDVWYEYKPEPNQEGKKYPFHFPFNLLDNVVLSPHRGASPFDDLKRWDEVIENLTRLALGKTDFLNEVNLEMGY